MWPSIPSHISRQIGKLTGPSSGTRATFERLKGLTTWNSSTKTPGTWYHTGTRWNVLTERKYKDRFPYGNVQPHFAPELPIRVRVGAHLGWRISRRRPKHNIDGRCLRVLYVRALRTYQHRSHGIFILYIQSFSIEFTFRCS